MPWDAASPKAMLLRPTNIDLLDCDCQLPTMESAGGRSRPVRAMLCVGRIFPVAVEPCGAGGFGQPPLFRGILVSGDAVAGRKPQLVVSG